MKPPEKLPRTPPNVPKLSKLIAEFGEPLLAHATNREQFELAMGLAVELWNIGSLPEAGQPEAFWKFTESLRNRPSLSLPGHAAADLADLVEKRKTTYAWDRRIVRHHRLVWEKGEPRLEVVSYNLQIAAGMADDPPAKDHA